MAAAPRTQMLSPHSRTTMSETSARLGGKRRDVSRSGPTKCSLRAIRPAMITLAAQTER